MLVIVGDCVRPSFFGSGVDVALT